jgi:hypothetical protein
MKNVVLREAADRVVANRKVLYHSVSMQLTDSATGSRNAAVKFINNFRVTQNFAEDISMAIYISWKMTPWSLLYVAGDGPPNASVTIAPCDIVGRWDVEDAKVLKGELVLIVDPAVLAKAKAMPNSGHLTDLIDCSGMLVYPSALKARSSRIGGVLPKASVEDAIHYIANQFGMSSVAMPPPNNKHVYDNIVLDGYSSLDECMYKLQQKYGVYEAGISTWVKKNNNLVVWPAYDTTLSQSNSEITFYQVDQGDYAGTNGLGRYLGSDSYIEVVYNQSPVITDLSVVGAEAAGSGFVMLKASSSGGGRTTVDSKDGAKFTEDHTVTVHLNKVQGGVKDAKRVTYIGKTDNPYPKMAQILSTQAILAKMDWAFSSPFSLHPFTKVTYQFDDNDVLKKRTGVIESIETISKLTMQRNDNFESIFALSSTFTLRLSKKATTG